MASAEFALVCGLKVRLGCQNRLCVNSDADETSLIGKQICEKVLPHSCEKKFKFQICYVTFK